MKKILTKLITIILVFAILMPIFTSLVNEKNEKFLPDILDTDIYDVERRPVISDEITDDRASELSFSDQIDNKLEYADDNIIVIIYQGTVP